MNRIEATAPNRLPNRRLEEMAAAVAEGVSLNHISRESSDIRRLANFYKEVVSSSFQFFLFIFYNHFNFDKLIGVGVGRYLGLRR